MTRLIRHEPTYIGALVNDGGPTPHLHQGANASGAAATGASPYRPPDTQYEDVPERLSSPRFWGDHPLHSAGYSASVSWLSDPEIRDGPLQSLARGYRAPRCAAMRRARLVPRRSSLVSS